MMTSEQEKSSMCRPPGRHAEFLGFLAAVQLVLCCTGVLRADGPKVSGLFPIGGQVGQSVDCTIRGTAGTMPVTVWCNRPGVTAEVSEDGKTVRVSLAEEATPGLALLRFANSDGASDLLPFLISPLPNLQETEPNNTLADANVVESLPVIVNGVLHQSGEVDTMAVDLKAGEKLVVSVEANRVLGSPIDPVVQLLSEEGFVLAQNDDHHGFDPQLTLASSSDQRVFVRVFGFPASPNSTINFYGSKDSVYRLTLTTGPFVNHDLRCAGQNPQQGLVGWNLDAHAASSPLLPGRHDLFPREDDLAWSWVNEQTAPMAVRLPAAYLGRIDQPNGRAVFRVRANKGKPLRIRVLAQAFDSLLDPMLEIRDAQGQLVTESDGSSRDRQDVDLSWKPAADGEYDVSITDRFGHAGPEYVYRLLIEEEIPRFSLTLKDDRFLLPAGKELQIPVAIVRQAGFREAIRVEVMNLPEGVTAEAVQSEAKGESAKQVNLVLKNASAKAFQGPIRIVGHSLGDSKQESYATAETKSPILRTDQIWLTIKAAEEKSEQ